MADEVRALASRATESAKETQAVIDRAVRSVLTCVTLGEAAVEDVLGIEALAADAAAVVQEIASDTQAQGLVTIDGSASSIATYAISSAANAEETAAASQKLSSMSGTLTVLVGRFALPTESHASADQGAETLSRVQVGRRRPASSRSKQPSPRTVAAATRPGADEW